MIFIGFHWFSLVFAFQQELLQVLPQERLGAYMNVLLSCRSTWGTAGWPLGAIPRGGGLAVCSFGAA
jgi:hypothetical protein